jgi:hypothetical protein
LVEEHRLLMAEDAWAHYRVEAHKALKEVIL